jgi:large subunit ribosomal protein L31
LGFIEFPPAGGIVGGSSEAMKQGIHPNYVETTVKCGCGNTFTTRSTREELKVDICNVCHPFYTGKLKFVDTAGRIEKFKSKFANTGYASLKRKSAAAAPSPSEGDS